jgi:GNAT superfamily N-acetyltransferase
VSGFSADWLALRGPADDAARSQDLARAFARTLKPGAEIVDLGAGTGAMGRWLRPFLPKRCTILSVDGDAMLLPRAKAPRLRRSLAGRLPPADAYVSTALIDLVSIAWLRKFLKAAHGKPVLMCLAVDGRHELTPAHAADKAIFAAFAAHQRRWKGLGQALGPDAPEALIKEARRLGWHVESVRSDWDLKSGALLEATFEGIVDAAGLPAPCVKRTRLIVGHRDVLLIPRRYRRTDRSA